MRRQLLALLVVAAASGAAAGIVPKAQAEKETLAPAPPPSRASKPFPCPIPSRFRAAFEAAARDTGLPLALLLAVARVESNLDPDARSSSGAHGLLQLMPTTAAELRLDLYHPPSNILAGARYLRQMLDGFRSTDLALAGYNAGPTAVTEAGGAPTNGTLTYVANVTALWRSLAGCT